MTKPAIKSDQMVKFANCRWQDSEITSKDYFTIVKLKNQDQFHEFENIIRK